MPLHPRQATVDVLTSGLAPYLGPSVARSAVLGVVARVALAGPVLDDAGVERILGELRPGLSVFVGRDKAEEVMVAIRKKLPAGGVP